MHRLGMLVLLLMNVACGDNRDNTNDQPTSDARIRDASPRDAKISTDAPDAFVPADAAPILDAAPAVSCTPLPCPAPDEECCVTSSTSQMCVAAGTCTGNAWACDGPEDCNGQVCCYKSGNTYGTECRHQCPSPVCQSENDCPQGQRCCYGDLGYCTPSNCP
jgi:hypothetical protein